MTGEQPDWTEKDSRAFIDTASYHVPEREAQVHAICSLIPDPGGPFQVLELACGPGVLAAAVLERFPAASINGLDGSAVMLQEAQKQLSNFGSRFRLEKFDLKDTAWRAPSPVYQAALSSLAIHHLNDGEKARLFRDLYAMLRPGGALLIADIIRPAGPAGAAYAADSYDEIVRKQSVTLTGNMRAFEQFEQEQWNLFRYPDDPVDKPSRLFDQLKWLEQAGFQQVDVFWMQAGHAVFGGYKPV